MGRTLLALAAAATAVLVGAPASAPAPDARKPIALELTVVLQPVDTSRACRFGAAAGGLSASCQATGAAKGKPGAAGAAYGWVWILEVGHDDVTTGRGTERGELALNFGRLGVLRVTTAGKQVPVGTPTATDAKGRTTGTWRLKSGTRGLKGRKGSGTYSFVTERTGSRTTFRVARITLRGTLR